MEIWKALEEKYNTERLCNLKVIIPESQQVGAIISKLPSSWNDYRKKLLHMAEDFTVEKILRHLRIEEETRKRDAVYLPQGSKVNHSIASSHLCELPVSYLLCLCSLPKLPVICLLILSLHCNLPSFEPRASTVQTPDNATNYRAAGEMLMEKRKKLFWIHCAAYCIYLMLEDLEKKIKVLRMVDSDEKPAMGFIYNEMEKAKQKIKVNFKDDRKSYDPIWKVIDERWEVQLHRPLHAAAYYLNPQLHFSSEFRADREVMRGLYKVMDRMLDDEERDKVDLQLEEFKHERGLFGFSSAKSMRFKKTPADWWESYGADTPELQKFSIRILSLTCSSSECERNWSAFEMVHTKRRNRLYQKKMNDLVFVMYNLKLKDKKIRKQVDLQVEDIFSDDEWIVEEETKKTITSRYNFNLCALGCGDDGDEESGGSQIGDEDAENMLTQQHATVDDLELPEEDEFDTLYDDDVGNDEDLDEI
ncbi:hypothetical protein CRG98_000603 [Punica granatum]|uniref:HAT C-terminal dimerisation domain-containing protein n=1 Tax=Punica granatum TaxID=22663 RepID=A0A2I0LE55_PUNGR|nr:hypothetical protein CRG98_000603 [Punica granatum]